MANETTVGSLRVLLSADTSGFATSFGKAKEIARSTWDGVRGSVSAAGQVVTTQVSGIGAAMRGIQPASAAAQQALTLMGSSGSQAVTSLSNALSGLLAGGFTPLGLAVAGLTAGVGLWVSAEKEVPAVLDETTRAVERHVARIAELRVERDLLARGLGTSASEVGLEIQIRKLESLKRQAGEASLGRSEVNLAPTEEEREIRKQIEAQELLVEQAREEVRLANEIAAERRAATEETKAQAAAAREVVSATSAVQTAPDPLADLRARLSTLRTAFEQERQSLFAEQSGQTPLQREILDQTERVSVARRQAASAARGQTGRLSEEATILRQVLQLEEQRLRVLQDAQRLEDDRASRSRRAAAEEQVRAGRAATLARKGEMDAEFRQAREEAARELLRAEEDLAFELEQLQRSEGEQRAAEVRREYRDLLDSAERYGLDRVRLEELIQRKITATAEKGTEKRVEGQRPEDLGPGSDRRENPFGVDLALMTRDEIAQGIPSVFEDIARNGRDAGQAMREFAEDFVWAVFRMAAQKALLQGINQAMSAFGIGSPTGTAGTAGTPTGGTPASTGAPAPAVPAAAHGGEWRVGGFGGLDSQMVRMKLSPGELIRVTNGANRDAGGGGDFRGTIVVRPPAVVADEVAAKMKPEARAGIVAMATSRPGRRGMRAGE